MLRLFIGIAVSPIVLKIAGVSCHGKEHHPIVPNLPPSVFAALSPKKQHIPPISNEPIFACLPDYDLLNGICIKEIIEPAKLACLGGILRNGRCEIVLPRIRTCPAGYTIDETTDICSRIIETETQFYCPKGFYDDGNACAQSLPGEMAYQCEFGDLVGDKCISKEHREYIIKSECPEGTTLLEDGNCWKEVETFDCSEAQSAEVVTVLAPPKHHTTTGKKVVVQKGKHSSSRLRSLVGKEHATPIMTPPPPPPPVKLVGPGKEMLAVTPPQATRVNVISQVCSKKVQVDALAIIMCPPDYVDIDGHCLKETIRTPITVCTSGSLKNSVCQPIVKRVPKHPGCPQGGYSSQGKCWMQEKAEALFICPPSYTEAGDDCIGFTDVIEYECPNGLSLEGESCIGTIERAPFRFNPELHTGHSKKY